LKNYPVLKAILKQATRIASKYFTQQFRKTMEKILSVPVAPVRVSPWDKPLLKIWTTPEPLFGRNISVLKEMISSLNSMASSNPHSVCEWIKRKGLSTL